MDSTRINEEEMKNKLDDLETLSKLLVDDLGVQDHKLGIRGELLGHVENHAHGEGYEVSESKISAFKDIMEALTDPDIYMIGLCGKDDEHIAYLLRIVQRRVRRDKLFGVTVMTSITKNPNLTRIQHEIADELGLNLEEQGKEDKTAFCGWIFSDGNKKVVSENARHLYDRILKESNILFILRDLRGRLDLEKLGIPFGAAHQGCKLILTSESEELLSNQMNAQRTFKF